MIGGIVDEEGIPQTLLVRLGQQIFHTLMHLVLQGNIGGHVVLQQAVKSIQIRRRGSNVVQRRSINTKGQVLIGQHPRMLLKKLPQSLANFVWHRFQKAQLSLAHAGVIDIPAAGLPLHAPCCQSR